MRPVLEYSSSDADPSSILLQEELEKVQKRAARFEQTTSSMKLEHDRHSITTKVELSKNRRRDNRIIMLCKGLKGATSKVRMTLSTQLGMSEIITLWYLLTYTRAISSPRLLEIGTHLQILSFLLPKVQKTLLLIKIRNRSFKSNENIHKKESGSYYVVSANKASSVTLQSPGNESQRKHTAILRISNRQSIRRLI